jgi:hypothetical protein
MRPISQFQNLLLAATWGQWFREGKNVFDGLAAAYGLLATVALVRSNGLAFIPVLPLSIFCLPLPFPPL